MNECDVRCSRLQRGVVIAYRLRLSDRPTNPQRLWHGRVEDVHAPMCWVRLLDPGYAGLDEMIFFEMQLPIPCYLIQTDDGKNILIDSGLPANFQAQPNMPAPQMGRNVIEQLAMIGVQPSAIDMLICTRYDVDHAGNHGAFSNAQLIAQRQHYEVARNSHPRFAPTRSQWDQPASRYRLVDGDTHLLPGLELIETSGHVPGHQSVLVRLPHTGPVLLTIDAVAKQESFTPDRQAGPMDIDGAGAIASTRKLLDLAQREHVSLVIFGHDGQQWSTLKKLPDYYD